MAQKKGKRVNINQHTDLNHSELPLCSGVINGLGKVYFFIPMHFFKVMLKSCHLKLCVS